METEKVTVTLQCAPPGLSVSVITISLITLPLHFSVIKVLLMDLRPSPPCIKIMLCLSFSDALQISIPFLCVVVIKSFHSTEGTMACEVLRNIAYFYTVQTMTVSSSSIVLMSIERYVACIHCLRTHEIFTRERLVAVISGIWVVGSLCAAIIVALNEKMSNDPGKVPRHLNIITIIVILPSSMAIFIIQCRLFAFSRSKLVTQPAEAFGMEAELADLRKKEMKIAFVVGIVVTAYMVCKLPMAILFLTEMIDGREFGLSTRAPLFCFSLLNNLIDPFIYAIGMLEMREALMKNFKRIKEMCLH